MVTTAFIVFLLCLAVSRLITSRSVATLSVEQKAMLVDASISKRPWFFIAVAALLAVWALASANFGHRDWMFVGFVILLLALAIPMLLFRLRRLSTLGLPHSYLRGARLSSVLVAFGLVLMLGAMVYSTLTFVRQ
jgi:Na+/H+ antiporter NhaD/arsenite permease-like protein